MWVGSAFHTDGAAWHVRTLLVAHQGRVQQPTSRIGWAIGMTYVRQVSCWTTLILIQ